MNSVNLYEPTVVSLTHVIITQIATYTYLEKYNSTVKNMKLKYESMK